MFFLDKLCFYGMFTGLIQGGPIAQLEEPPAHNRSVPGSNPGGPTNTVAFLRPKRIL